jgi:hypothetical protein
MAVTQLTYAALAECLKTSPEGARALAKRLRLPRTRSNDGKTLVAVDLAEIRHTAMPGRSPAGEQSNAAALKAKIKELQAKLAELDIVASGHRADFERERDRADRLMAEFLRATADIMTYQADLELERDRADGLVADLIKATADAMMATEAMTRLESELATITRSRWPWPWLSDVIPWLASKGVYLVARWRRFLAEAMAGLEGSFAHLRSQSWWHTLVEAIAEVEGELAAMRSGRDRVCSRASMLLASTLHYTAQPDLVAARRED